MEAEKSNESEKGTLCVQKSSWIIQMFLNQVTSFSYLCSVERQRPETTHYATGYV